VLESDVERKQDLDTEIKASGCFNSATADQLAEFDRLNEEYLDTRDTQGAQEQEEGEE